VIHVFNKMDIVPDPAGLQARALATFAPAACVSALRGELDGLGELLAQATHAPSRAPVAGGDRPGEL
jgi:hypothetical protein